MKCGRYHCFLTTIMSAHDLGQLFTAAHRPIFVASITTNSTIMKFEFNLSVSEIIINYLLMMAVIIGGGFSGQWWLGFLALPLFLRGLVGWCPIKTILKNSKAVMKAVPARQNSHQVAA